ncbi:hypothetical protein J6590_047023 [Homalodisca vitripennis]|nr:hypothetical protein J6590_047023 [Homalodisca vitripennis]
MAYYGLIHPQFAYGTPKKVVRIIGQLNYRESCWESFRELEFLTLPCIIFDVQCTLVRGEDIHRYETRGRDNYRAQHHRLTITQHLPQQVGVRFINELPESIKNSNNKNQLKTRLNRLLVSIHDEPLGFMRGKDLGSVRLCLSGCVEVRNPTNAGCAPSHFPPPVTSSPTCTSTTGPGPSSVTSATVASANTPISRTTSSCTQLLILKVILYSRSKCALVRSGDVHHHWTRGRDNFRVQQHRKMLSEICLLKLVSDNLPEGIKQQN